MMGRTTICGWLIGVVALASCDVYDDDDYTPPSQEGPPVARDDEVFLDEDDQSVAVSALANDDNVSGIAAHTDPEHGVIGARWGAPDSLIYTPRAGFYGTDSFTYTTHEGETATVTLHVASDGVPYEEATELDVGRHSTGVEAADFDGDGATDLAVVDYDRDQVSVCLNRTQVAHQFAFDCVHREAGLGPVSVGVGDFDADGRPDLAVTLERNNLVVVLANRTTGGLFALAPPIYLETQTAPRGLQVLDVNQDGLDDLLFIDQGVDIWGSSEGTLSVYLGEGAGASGPTFGQRYDFVAPTKPSDAEVADVDGDGSLDVVVAGRADHVLVTFVNLTAVGELVPAFEARFERFTAEDPLGIVQTDLDGDQRPELAVVSSLDRTVWIHPNQTEQAGSPIYGTATIFGTALTPSAIGLADADDDGVTDLLLGNASGSPSLELLLNRSSAVGQFELENQALGKVGKLGFRQETVSLSDATDLIVVDLDGADLPEIVVTVDGYSNGAVVIDGRLP